MDVGTIVFPASFAQRRLWFVTQLEPGSPFYHVPVTLGLSGNLDVGALERSLAAIVRRHEALRTTFTVTDGEPMQVVRDLGLELPVIQVGGDSAGEREIERERLSREEAIRPFDLERGPLFRARLFRLAADEHVLQLVFHHAVFDGWSGGVLLRELGECYQAYASGASPELPELAVQYGDFAVWQREWLKGEVLERQLGYWRGQLAGAPPVLELPADHRRPRVQSYRGATRRQLLPLSLLEQLKALSQREGASLFMTLMAAFQALLARYTGEKDIVVGTPIANRGRSELEGLIGFFVNSLALRADLSGDPTFRELLGRVREVALGAYDHQDLPFERLVEELQAGRLRDRNPVFQVMFAFQNASRSALRLPGITVRRLGSTMGISKFDLTLHVAEDSRGLRTSVEYSADLFEAATMDRLLDHYRTLLEGLVAEPDRCLSALPLMPADERRKVIATWSGIERPYDGHRCLHQLFESRAAERPEAVAVESAEAVLTYRELDRGANRLAHALRRLGVGPEARVGVALDRSGDMVVALLAVLKAGGAYVPLDPSYPPERIGFMLEDADVRLVVTVADTSIALPPGVTALRLDADRVRIEREPDHCPRAGTSPEHLAYVMYTSGSTGRPKGIGIPHRAVLRLVRNTDYVQLTANDVVAQVSNASFDAATFEIWGALLHGARLLVVPREVALSPRVFAEELRRGRVTAMFLTTALFNQVAEGVPGAFATVRHLMVGGEALDPRWVREVLRHGPPERLLNGYGPTETTTFATWHEMREVAETAVSIPIGRPIANTRACVLDRHLAPVPVGVPGELYVGGPGLARGYLGRPALTAERFVPDPFTAVPGARLYRTGDRVRLRTDGTLEFLGRLDEQVKVRGFRIEPGEVEASLAAHPAVRDCAVIARDDLPGGRALVAYVVPRSPSQNGHAPSDDRWSAALRGYLQDRLPHYMVPSAFVALDRLPLSPNGKVARRSLPAPVPLGSAASAPPRTPIERELARIWCELLGIEQAGLADDFFDHGGHSLLAVRLFSEIERTFERRLPLSTLFLTSTLGGLAELLARERPRQSGTGLVPLMPRGSRPPLFVVHNVDGDLLEYRELLSLLGPDQPAYGFEPRVSPGGRPVLGSLEQLAAGYVHQMREAQPAGPYYVCGYCWAGPLAFEMARQLDAAGQQVGLLALIDTRCPGTRPPRKIHVRIQQQGGRLWRLLADNAERLVKLRPKSIPDFLRQRVVNVVTRIAGVAAYRWSIRVRRPLLPVFRSVRGALLHAGWSYRPGAFSGRVTLFYAQPPGDPPRVDRSMGWDKVAALGADSHEIPGEHFGIMLRPEVEHLAAQLRACLDRAQANTP